MHEHNAILVTYDSHIRVTIGWRMGVSNFGKGGEQNNCIQNPRNEWEWIQNKQVRYTCESMIQSTNNEQHLLLKNIHSIPLNINNNDRGQSASSLVLCCIHIFYQCIYCLLHRKSLSCITCELLLLLLVMSVITLDKQTELMCSMWYAISK